jgi:transposase
MDILYTSCAGLDVHKETVVATVRRLDAKGKVRQETRTFGTMTSAILELADWLAAEEVTHAAKIPQLRQALQGRVTEHHRFLLKLLLDEVTHLEDLIARLSERIVSVLPPPFAEAVQLLATIPGIDERAAENILAEIGVNMDQFPTDGHLSSWSGMCSGNRESAGKRQSGRSRKGDQWLRATLVQSAWAASHTKKTYLSAQYRRLAGRRGKKRALFAVGHTILVIIYHMLQKKKNYQELGADYFDRLETGRLTRGLVRRLERLGHEVILKPKEPAA